MSPLDTVTAGDEVPALERTIDAPSMVAYAGATWDWHRLHYDRDYLAAKGLPAPVVDGQVLGALLVEMLQDWLGPQAFVRRLSLRYADLVFAGETVRCEGTVDSVADGVLTASLRVAVVEGGRVVRVAAEPCGAEVVAR